MAASPLLQTALQYRSERGWNVIPLARGEKTPMEGFPLSEFFQRKMTEEELVNWFERPEAGNIGLLAGPTSGVWVADIDDASLVEDFTARYPSDLMSRTPSGGLHVFYQYDENERIPNGHIGSGIDVISQGKYVLISPSFVKRAGHGGQVVSGVYEWLRYGQPSKAPSGVIRAVMSEVSPDRMSNVSRQEAMGLLSYAFQNGKFMQGRHNETIYYGALILASDGVPEELIVDMMLGFDKRDPSPQGPRAVRAACENAFRVVERKREQDDFAGVQLVIQQAPQVLTPTLSGVRPAAAKDPFAITTYEMATQYYGDYTTKWLVEGWILEESVMMVSAPPERYKTWLTADLAVSVATGGLFLGQYPVAKTGDVLVVQQEDFGARLINRYNKIEHSKFRYYDNGPGFNVTESERGYELTTEFNPEWNTIYFHTEGALKLDDPASLAAFVARVREIKPVLVVIDPFYSLSNKTDDYYAGLADIIRHHIKDLRNEIGCSIVFVHHTNKASGAGGDPTQRQGAWGSQFINAVMEGMIMLAQSKGMGENSVAVYRRFKDAPSQPVVDLTFHIADAGDTEYDVELNNANSLENEVKQYLLDNGPTKLSDLYEEFGDRFSSKPQLTNWLKDADGISKQGRGVYALAPDVHMEL